MIKIDVIKIITTFWEVLNPLWFIWLTIFIVIVTHILIDVAFRKIKHQQRRKWLAQHKNLLAWRKIDGRVFEEVVAAIFENLGYKTKIIGGAGDRGIDVIAEKDNKKIFIQCKQMEVVGPKHIREFIGALDDGADGLLVTTGGFTAEGREAVSSLKNKKITLIDGLKLEKLAQSTED